jgi:hypothetical protein
VNIFVKVILYQILHKCKQIGHIKTTIYLSSLKLNSIKNIFVSILNDYENNNNKIFQYYEKNK